MRLRYWVLLILLVVDLISFFISWYGWTVEDHELYYLFILLGILVLFILLIAVGYITARARWMLFFKRRARTGRVNVISMGKTFVYPIVVHFVGSDFGRDTNFQKIINAKRACSPLSLFL